METPSLVLRPAVRVRVRTLARAANLLGGPEPLRRRLNVSAFLLAAWLTGAQVPPTDVFLRAVDIVEEAVTESIKKGAE